MSSIPAKAIQEQIVSTKRASADWKFFALLLAVLLGCYATVLYHLGVQWATDEDMGHGFFVPVVAGYIAWRRRDELRAIDPQPSYWGVAVIVLGGLQMLIGALAAELFIQRTAFLVSLVGVLLLAGGKKLVRHLAFPLFLLLFMIPIPAIIYSQLTLRLQLFASSVAEMLLGLIGIPVLRDGNVLQLPSETLSVVEACSGIRSLLSLSFLSLVYAYFFDSKPWMRAALLVATVPIAIVANAGRVTLTGVLGEYAPTIAHGVFHTLEGGVLFLVALLILTLVHQLLNWIHRAWRRVPANGGSVGA